MFKSTLRTILNLSVLLFLLPTLLSSYTIEISPSTEECFYADLLQHDMMLLSYDVLDGGDLLVDFKLYNPFGVMLQSTPGRKDAYYSYNASNPGPHKYCFGNQVISKKVSFNLNIVKHNPDPKKDAEQVGIDEEITKLEDYINKIESQFAGSIARNFNHKRASETTDSRLWWWTLFQVLAVFGICAYQVTYLKSFFEVRRVV